MSLMSGLRDTIATIAFDRRLQTVRERQIAGVLDGAPLSDDALREAEKDAALAVARQMYNDDAALAMGIAEQAGERDHRKDYGARSSAQGDVSVLTAHRIICGLPIVGDPAHGVR
jgi:hypothetical protein